MTRNLKFIFSAASRSSTCTYEVSNLSKEHDRDDRGTLSSRSTPDRTVKSLEPPEQYLTWIPKRKNFHDF